MAVSPIIARAADLLSALNSRSSRPPAHPQKVVRVPDSGPGADGRRAGVPPLPSAGPSGKEQRVTAALPPSPTHVMGSHGFPGWFWTALGKIKAGQDRPTARQASLDRANP